MQLAELLQWSGQGRIGNYERDEREPTIEDIKHLSSVLGVSAKEIIFGRDEGDNPTIIQVTSDNDNYLYVAMAKPRQSPKGIELQPASLPPLAIPKSKRPDLNEHTTGLLALHSPNDDGMAPYITTTDTVVIDTSKTSLDDGDVYFISLNSKCLIRRLYTSASSVILRSLNHPDKTIPEQDTAQLQILGKVIYRAG